MLQKWTFPPLKAWKTYFSTKPQMHFLMSFLVWTMKYIVCRWHLYNNLFDPPFHAIFLKMFYGSQANDDYLLGIVIPYLEALHSFKMQVCKFVECNPFGRIENVFPFDHWYEKLAEPCSSKCNDIFCNRMKSKPINKKN